jgi:hypothetical protein
MKDLQRMLNEMFGQVQRNFNEAEAVAAKRDPKAHKLSRVSAKGSRYVYTPGGKDGRGRTIWFCRSTQRNVAGYFLCWRQIETPAKKKATKPGDLVSTIKRDQWSGFKSKKSAIALCRRRAAAFKAKRSKA